MRATALPLLLLAIALAAADASAEPLTLPTSKRPEWLRKDGIVMAGSWEPLIFRVRRDGGSGYTPTAEQLEDYRREHSPEMIERLKQIGVNFVMMHCYKGGGLMAEGESMADAVRFARLCHEAGMRVGVYNYSGAFIWELFFKEVPQASDWVLRDADGKPVTYGKAAYRYYFNRNHAAAEAFYRRVVQFAVRDVGADLIHFDNYHHGPAHDACSVDRFRAYLRTTFPADRLAAHQIDPRTALPPAPGAKTLIGRAWADFCCQSIANSYHAMSRYARGLRPDVLVECNPHGVSSVIRPPIDHGRLLQGGEAYWDESLRPGLQKGGLRTRIRTYKVARAMNNTAFAYTTSALEAAESMAFNLDCLGAICWFEYARIVERPGRQQPMSTELAPYVRFFHARRDLFRDARVVADAGVLRSFPSMVFGAPADARLTAAVEDALIQDRGCFQILHEHQLDKTGDWPCLVLAGCAALSDAAIKRIEAHVARGGRLCVIGPLATHDEWMLPRSTAPLVNLPQGSVVRAATGENPLQAIDRACGRRSLVVSAPEPGLCAELTEQPGRRMVHLVNYGDDRPAEQVRVKLRVPVGRKAVAVALAGPAHEADLPRDFRQQGDTVDFTVPRVGVYEIAVVSWR